MNFRFFLRKTQALHVTILLSSLAACTSPKTHDGAASTTSSPASAPATTAPITAAAGPAAGTPAPGSANARKPGGTPSPGKESALDSQLAGLRQQVAARREYNDALRAYVDGKEKQLAALLAADRSAGPNAQEFDLRTSTKSKIVEIDREAPAWQQKIDAHKAVLSKAGDDPQAKELQTQIDQLSEQRAELLRQRARLAAIPDKLKQ
jgi:hypothetical protein